MSTVLVTGGTGFIGRHALPALVRAGHDVHAVVRVPDPQSAGVTWHAADLLDPGAAEDVAAAARASHLLHLGWYAEHGRFWHAPENVRWVESTLALFRSFASHGGERAVMAGTGAEYDWMYGFCSEDVTPCRPATLYGVSKDATHRVVAAAGQQLGVQVAWGRVFFLYGPHEHPDRLVASVAHALSEGRPAPISSGVQVRDFMHSEDVGRAFATLVDHSAVGPINVASGEAVSVRDVARTLGRLAARPDLVEVGALPDRVGEPPLLVADVRRLRDEVGFAPRFSLTAGLSETLDVVEVALTSRFSSAARQPSHGPFATVNRHDVRRGRGDRRRPARRGHGGGQLDRGHAPPCRRGTRRSTVPALCGAICSRRTSRCSARTASVHSSEP